MAPDGVGRFTDPCPVPVGHYGGVAADRLAADDRCVPQSVESDPAAAPLDCLPVGWDAHETPPTAVATGADPGVPVVVCAPAVTLVTFIPLLGRPRSSR